MHICRNRKLCMHCHSWPVSEPKCFRHVPQFCVVQQHAQSACGLRTKAALRLCGATTGKCCQNTLGSLCVWFWINFWLLQVQRPFTVLQYFGTLTFSYKSSYRSPNLNLWAVLLILSENYLLRCVALILGAKMPSAEIIVNLSVRVNFKFSVPAEKPCRRVYCRRFPFLQSWQHCFTVVYCTQPSCLFFPTSQHLHLSYSTQKNFKI